MITVYFIVMTAMSTMNGGLKVQNAILQDTKGMALYTDTLEDCQATAIRHAGSSTGNPRKLLASGHIVMNCVAMDIPKRGQGV